MMHSLNGWPVGPFLPLFSGTPVPVRLERYPSGIRRVDAAPSVGGRWSLAITVLGPLTVDGSGRLGPRERVVLQALATRLGSR